MAITTTTKPEQGETGGTAALLGGSTTEYTCGCRPGAGTSRFPAYRDFGGQHLDIHQPVQVVLLVLNNVRHTCESWPVNSQ
jgi:hypothetical protein